MAKKDVPHMVRGLNMGLRLLSLLIEETSKNGGTEEMLHFLTTDAGRENLERVAKFIVSLKWMIPKSAVMALARQKSLQEWSDGEHADNDQNFRWTEVLDDLKIPVQRFTLDEDDTSFTSEIPLELSTQLHGKTALPGMIIEWNGNPFVVVGLVLDGGRVARLNEIIDAAELYCLDLSPAHHFDLSR